MNKNLPIENEIKKEEIPKLEESKKIEYFGPQHAMDSFSAYVESCLADLSANGHTKELLEHILTDLKNIKTLNLERPKTIVNKYDENKNTEGTPSIDDPYIKYTGNLSSEDSDSKASSLLDDKESIRFSPPVLVDLHALLHKKNLSPDLFKNRTVVLEADISQHAKWAFEHIYSIPYSSEDNKKKQAGIARYIHGIQHVSRVAINVRIFANLYIDLDIVDQLDWKKRLEKTDRFGFFIESINNYENLFSFNSV